jgi:hypothetical protein
MWLLLRRDIWTRLGRFAILAGSLVVILALVLMTALSMVSYIERTHDWQSRVEPFWLIGRLPTPDSIQLSTAAWIPSEQADRLMALPGVDAQTSYRGTVFIGQFANFEFFDIAAVDPPGLVHLGGVTPEALASRKSDTLWMSPTALQGMGYAPGEQVELWGKLWRISLLPKSADQLAVMVERKAVRHLLGADVINFMVLGGNPDPEAVRREAGNLTAYPPGSVHAWIYGHPGSWGLEQWIFPALCIAAFIAVCWVIAAIPGWEQLGRAGVLRALGAPLRTRIGPLLLFGLLQLAIASILSSLFILGLLMDSRVNQRILLVFFMKYGQFSIPLVFLAALLVQVPHALRLARMPCIPRQEQPRGLGLPLLVIFSFTCLMMMTGVHGSLLVLNNFSSMSKMRSEYIEIRPIARDEASTIPLAVVQRLLSLPEVDQAKSWGELITWEAVGPTGMIINVRGIPPNRLHQALFDPSHSMPAPIADEALIGKAVAAKLGLKTGDRLMMFSHEWNIIGVIEGPHEQFHGNELMVSHATLAAQLNRPLTYDLLLLHPRHRSSMEPLIRAIEREWGERPPFHLLTPSQWDLIEAPRFKEVGPQLVYSLTLFVSTFLFMLTIYNVRANFHLRELAVLRALGASHMRAARAVMREGVILTLLSLCVAAVMGIAFPIIFRELLTVELFAGLLIGGGITTLAATLGMLPPVLRALKLAPTQLMRMD